MGVGGVGRGRGPGTAGTGPRVGPAPAAQEPGGCAGTGVRRPPGRGWGQPLDHPRRGCSDGTRLHHLDPPPAPALAEHCTSLSTPHVHAAGWPGDGDQVSAADRGAQDVRRRCTGRCVWLRAPRREAFRNVIQEHSRPRVTCQPATSSVRFCPGTLVSWVRSSRTGRSRVTLGSWPLLPPCPHD